MTRDDQWLLTLIRAIERKLVGVVGTGGLVPGSHGTTHADGGTDSIDVTTLSGFPGGSPLLYLDSDGNFTDPTGAVVSGDRFLALTWVIDGDGAVISTGSKDMLRFPVAGTIVEVSAVSMNNVSGSVEIDVWKKATPPPTNGESITGGNELTLTGATYGVDSTLTSWSPSVSAGDFFNVNIDTVSGFTKLAIIVLVELV